MKEQTKIPTRAYASHCFTAFLRAALLVGIVSKLLSQQSALAVGAKAASTTRQGGGIVAETMALENRAGLKWELLRTTNGWALGTISIHGKPVEQAATKGLLALRDMKSGEVRWLAASQGEKTGPRTARFSDQQEIEGVKLSWAVEVALREDLPAASLTSQWSVDKDLNGWEVCLAYHDGFTNDWRVQSYPWAGNSKEASLTPISAVVAKAPHEPVAANNHPPDHPGYHERPPDAKASREILSEERNERG